MVRSSSLPYLASSSLPYVLEFDADSALSPLAPQADGREVILSQDGTTDQVQAEQPANSTGLETVGEKERREAEEEKGKRKVA